MVEKKLNPSGSQFESYVSSRWEELTRSAETLSRPAPDVKTAQNLASTLETSWEVLIKALEQLPAGDKLAYWQRLTRNFDIKEKFTSLSWRNILELRAKKEAAEYNSRERPFNLKMSETEGKVHLMTDRFLKEILGTTGDSGRVRQDASSLYTVMLAFRAALPWNRTGFNSVTLGDIRPDVARDAQAYARKRLTRLG